MLLTNEKGETLRRLQSLISECVHVDIVVGYMSAQGFALLEESFTQCLASGGTVDIIVGELCAGGDYERCQRLVDAWPGKLNIYVSTMPNRLVHGKVYLLQQHLQSLMIIGSSNLTCGGLQANAEINVEIPAAADGLERVRSYIAFLKTYAVPLEESTLESDVGGIKMGSSEANVRLDRQSIKTLRRFAERLMGQISKDEIDKWCREIDDMSAMFNDALSLDSLRSGKWTGESVKTELLMKHVWAVREARHTALLPRIRATPGDRIVSKLLDMVAAADQELPSDEVIQMARIPDVIGISIASEVLHKCRPDKYVIKNKRSHWGMAFILDQGDGPEYPQDMAYSTFQRYVDLILHELTIWLSEHELTFDSRYGYYICDRFFLLIFEDDNNSELISMYNKGRSEHVWM